jgi:hypothetical protein
MVYEGLLFLCFSCFLVFLRCDNFWREYNLKMGYMNMDMIFYGTLGIVWKMRTLLMGSRMMMMFWGLFWLCWWVLAWNCVWLWFTVLIMFILMLTRFFFLLDFLHWSSGIWQWRVKNLLIYRFIQLRPLLCLNCVARSLLRKGWVDFISIFVFYG